MTRLRQLALAGFAAAGLLLGFTAAPAPAQAGEIVQVHDRRGWDRGGRHYRHHHYHGPRWHRPPPARYYAPPPRYYRPPPVRYYAPPPPRYYRPPPGVGVYLGF